MLVRSSMLPNVTQASASFVRVRLALRKKERFCTGLSASAMIDHLLPFTNPHSYIAQACKLLDKIGRKVLKLLCLSLEANQYTLHQLLDNLPHANYQSSSRLECVSMKKLFRPVTSGRVQYGSMPRRQEAGLLDVVAGDQPEIKVSRVAEAAA